jgi:hypothetical protein
VLNGSTSHWLFSLGHFFAGFLTGFLPGVLTGAVAHATGFLSKRRRRIHRLMGGFAPGSMGIHCSTMVSKDQSWRPTEETWSEARIREHLFDAKHKAQLLPPSEEVALDEFRRGIPPNRIVIGGPVRNPYAAALLRDLEPRLPITFEQVVSRHGRPEYGHRIISKETRVAYEQSCAPDCCESADFGLLVKVDHCGGIALLFAGSGVDGTRGAVDAIFDVDCTSHICKLLNSASFFAAVITVRLVEGRRLLRVAELYAIPPQLTQQTRYRAEIRDHRLEADTDAPPGSAEAEARPFGVDGKNR